MSKQVIGPYGEQLLAKNGLTEEVAPWEDGRRADTGPGSFEWWYFDAHLDDGSTAVAVFATKLIQNRNKDLTPTLQLTITTADGRMLKQSPVFGADQFDAAIEGCNVRIGPSHVRGDLTRYELHAEAGGLVVDLAFTRVAPSWRPGCGISYYDSDLLTCFGWLAPLPYGTVEGTLMYDGVSRTVRGVGYHDHNWANVGLERVVSYWYWGRAHVGDYSLIFADIVRPADYSPMRSPMFMAANGGRLLTGVHGGTMELTVGSEQPYPKGRPYPAVIDIEWREEAGTAQLALRAPKIIEAFNPLDQLPEWEHLLVGLFAKPYYFRFTGELEFSLNLAAEHTLQRGSALWELMFLR